MDFTQKCRNFRDLRVLTEEQMGSLSREKDSPQLPSEDEKRARRQIANSNERRRMQCINSGFQRIKSLLPRCEEEKMSKSAILHQAVDYIHRLEQEKQLISQQNEELTWMLRELKTKPSMQSAVVPPLKRRRENDLATSDLTVTSVDSTRDCSQTTILSELQNLVMSLKEQLDNERQRRVAMEKTVDSLKTCLRMERAADSVTDSASDKQIATSSVVGLPIVPASSLLPTKDQATTTASCDILTVCERSSVARRNLETIVKAIHHVEGGQISSNQTDEFESTDEEKLSSQSLDTVFRHHQPMLSDVTVSSPESLKTFAVSHVSDDVSSLAATLSGLQSIPILISLPGFSSDAVPAHYLPIQKPSL